MSNDPTLPGAQGDLVTDKRKATPWFYAWFQRVHERLVATEATADAATAAVAAIPESHTPEVYGIPGEVVVYGSADTDWTLGVAPEVLANRGGGQTIIIREEHYEDAPPMAPSPPGQVPIQFKDEGSGIGSSGAVTAVDFTGAGVTASHSGGVVTVNIAGSSGGITAGTSNPGSPTDGDLFYRSDLGLLIRYHSTGTRWMTVNEYTMTGIQFDTPPYATTKTAPVRYGLPSDYGLYLTRMILTMYVLTTSSGTQYWTFDLYQYTAAEVVIGGTLGSASTVSAAANTVINYDVALNVALNATAKILYPVFTKVSTPGNLYPSYTLLYRKIIT